MKFQYPFLIAGGMLLLLFTAISSFSADTPTPFEKGKELLVFRKIGHEILLNVGDKTSRVLPVKTINQSEFELRFERSFAFKPDSITTIIDRVFQQHAITKDYIVNVLACANNQIVYGYAVIASEQNEIVPCKDRGLEENCYYVNIKFDVPEKSFLQYGSVRGGLALLGFLCVLIGLVKYRPTLKIGANEGSNTVEGLFSLGTSVFNLNEHFILCADKKIKLTAKEAKLLYVLLQKQNQVVERTELDEKVWNAEGVIVGRSLDIFISKLRKKLKADPAITIVNIYGKGYKLEIT